MRSEILMQAILLVSLWTPGQSYIVTAEDNALEEFSPMTSLLAKEMYLALLKAGLWLPDQDFRMVDISFGNIVMYKKPFISQRNTHHYNVLHFNATIPSATLKCNYTFRYHDYPVTTGILWLVFKDIQVEGWTSKNSRDSQLIYQTFSEKANVYMTDKKLQRTIHFDLKPVVAKRVIKSLNYLFGRDIKEMIDEYKDTEMENNIQVMNVHSSESLVDKIIDNIIALGREYIISHNMDQIPVQDISESFNRGYFRGTKGWFRRLSTLHRVGDVAFYKNNLTIVGDFSLSEASVGFGSYVVKYMIFRVKGSITGVLASNRVRIGLSLHIDEKGCSFQVSDLQVVELGRVSVKLSGFGMFDHLVSDRVSDAVSRKLGQMTPKLEQIAKKHLQEVLSRVNCNDIIPKA